MMPRTSLLFLALAGTAGTLTTEALAAAPRYKMVLDSANAEHGVKTVSLVQNPAIQRNWVTLAAVEPTAPAATLFHLGAVTEGGQSKQVLTGPALVPGQEILRLDAQGNPFYITFDADNIEATCIQFAAQGHHTSTNQAHAVGLTGNVVYESWIVADAEKDKAAALGLAVEPGMWMLSVKIADPDYWQNEVVSGNVRGFSIEGLFDSVQLNLSAVAPAPTPVSEKNWFQKTFARLSALATDKQAEAFVLLGLEQLADGRAVQIDDTTGVVTLATGEALPDGTYPLANGGELVVQQGKRADNGGQGAPATAQVDASNPAAPSVPAAEPTVNVAPLADTATTADIAKAVNSILDFIKKDGAQEKKEDATSTPAAPKMAAALHGVQLADVAAKFTELKLDAIELEGGDKLTLNPVSRRLSNADGSLVESGYFAAADGSYFCVSTDQWFYQIDKQTYDAVYSAKLSAVELAEVKIKLAQEPAGRVIKLHGDGAATQADAQRAPHLAFLHSVRAANGK